MLTYLLTVLCISCVLQEGTIGSIIKSNIFYNSTPKSVFLKDNNGFINNIHKERHNLGIVNGQPATRGQFCYTVYLQFSDGKSYWSCGGSLVTSTIILTAAHCVLGAVSGLAVLGALDLSLYGEPGHKLVRVPSSGLIVHDQYDENNFYNDIALMKMSKPISLNKYICTVQLPSCSSSALSENNNDYTVSGWGKTSDKTLTSSLMYVNLSRESQASCASFYKRYVNYQVAVTQMCTSGTNGKGICNGDSGGPLVQPDSSGRPIQKGIVSLGISSCETSAPSVYTDVTFYMSWLCPYLNQEYS